MLYKAGFDENQPRDDEGRWSDTGAGSGASDAESYAGALSRKEVEDLQDYQSSGYHQINQSLRTGAKPSVSTQRQIASMDAAVKKGVLPKETMLFRGISTDALPDSPSDLVGKTLVDKAFLSASSDKGTAQHFASWASEKNRGAVVQIRAPAGTRGAYMEKVLPKLGAAEKEFLLPRGTQLRVTAVKNYLGVVYVHAEVLP